MTEPDFSKWDRRTLEEYALEAYKRLRQIDQDKRLAQANAEQSRRLFRTAQSRQQIG